MVCPPLPPTCNAEILGVQTPVRKKRPSLRRSAGKIYLQHCIWGGRGADHKMRIIMMVVYFALTGEKFFQILLLTGLVRFTFSTCGRRISPGQSFRQPIENFSPDLRGSDGLMRLRCFRLAPGQQMTAPTQKGGPCRDRNRDRFEPPHRGTDRDLRFGGTQAI